MAAHPSPWSRFGKWIQTTINIPADLHNAAKGLVGPGVSFNSIICQALLDYLRKHMGSEEYATLCDRESEASINHLENRDE